MPLPLDEVIDSLGRPGGVDDYFSDIVYVRDAVDPPVRRSKRQNADLSITLDADEYDIVGGVDIMQGKLTLAFGLGGVVEIADVYSEVFEPEDEAHAIDIVHNGVRLALAFQASKLFATNRATIDGDFLYRLKNALPTSKTSAVPYDRMPFIFPDQSDAIKMDPAMQYRISRMASYIALDRVCSYRYGRASLKDSKSDLKSTVVNAMNAKVAEEMAFPEASVGSSDAPTEEEALHGANAGNLITALHDKLMPDNYPLMWAALANPASADEVGSISLPHIGKKRHVRPGWINLSDVIDN